MKKIMIDNRNAKIIAFALVAVLLLIGTVGIASVAIGSAVGYESDLPIIYDNWNPDACDTTDTSIWSLDKDTLIYEIAIWYKDWPSEGTVSYVIEKDGVEFRKGYFMKGACHHKYTYWCRGSDTPNMVFPTGTYVMKLSGSNQCQNSGSNGNGFVKLLGPTPTYETPTGYWNFNEGSGNIAYDSSGSGIDGTIHGATWVDNGSCKKALSFDGVDDYVQTNPATFQSNDITVEAWIYPKSFSSYKTILHKGDRRGANNFLFTFDLISNKISFFISSNGNTFNSVIGTTNLELNKWYHVVGVYRSRDKFFAVYVNGTEDNSKTSTLSSLYHDASKYWIGARYDNRQFLSDRYFNGIIDEVRIYDRALNQSEIQADMNECAPSLATIQVPIDSTGNRTTVPPINVNGVDYALVGVMYVDSPDSPLDAAGSELPQEVTVNLEELGMDYVETIYLATQNAWSFDMPNDVKVATLVCEYAEGGPPTTLDLIMGVNTAEWALENPTQAAAFGAQPPHSMPPVITSTPTTGDSDQEYIAHTYAASVSLDPTRTLSSLRLELVDVNQLLAYRSPSYGVPTLIAQACMAVTLEGRSATQIPTHISIDEATHAEMIDVSQNGAALYNDRSVEVGEEKARQDTVNWLKEQDIIADAGLSEDGTTIWIDYANGVKGAIFTATQVEESAPGSFSSLRQDYRSLKPVSMMATNLRQDLSSAGNHPNMVGNHRAIMLCPFKHQIKSHGKDATDRISEHLRSCGFDVDYMSNQEVTVELLKNINHYGVIYLATHGGLWKEGIQKGETALCSGEKATTNRTNGIYAEDISKGRIGIETTVGDSEESYYFVFPSFFNYSSGKSFPKSLVYISACNSLTCEDMAKTFLAEGVAAYIGYKGFTSIGFAVRVTDEPFFRLLAGKCITVEEAKNWKRKQGYGGGHPLLLGKMHFLGSGKTVICEAEVCPPCVGPGLQLDAGNSSWTVNGENFSVRCTYLGRSHDLLQDEPLVDDVSSSPGLESELIPDLSSAQDSLGNEQFVDMGSIYITTDVIGDGPRTVHEQTLYRIEDPITPDTVSPVLHVIVDRVFLYREEYYIHVVVSMFDRPRDVVINTFDELVECAKAVIDEREGVD